MSNLIKGNIDLEPIYTFLTEDTSPKELSKLLDEFLYDYLMLHFAVQASDYEDKTIHEKTSQFIFYIKTLRDILPYCEKG